MPQYLIYNTVSIFPLSHNQVCDKIQIANTEIYKENIENIEKIDVIHHYYFLLGENAISRYSLLASTDKIYLFLSNNRYG